jgi:hypothetical protein
MKFPTIKTVPNKITAFYRNFGIVVVGINIGIAIVDIIFTFFVGIVVFCIGIAPVGINGQLGLLEG